MPTLRPKKSFADLRKGGGNQAPLSLRPKQSLGKLKASKGFQRTLVVVLQGPTNLVIQVKQESNTASLSLGQSALPWQNERQNMFVPAFDADPNKTITLSLPKDKAFETDLTIELVQLDNGSDRDLQKNVLVQGDYPVDRPLLQHFRVLCKPAAEALPTDHPASIGVPCHVKGVHVSHFSIAESCTITGHETFIEVDDINGSHLDSKCEIVSDTGSIRVQNILLHGQLERKPVAGSASVQPVSELRVTSKNGTVHAEHCSAVKCIFKALTPQDASKYLAVYGTGPVDKESRCDLVLTTKAASIKVEPETPAEQGHVEPKRVFFLQAKTENGTIEGHARVMQRAILLSKHGKVLFHVAVENDPEAASTVDTVPFYLRAEAGSTNNVNSSVQLSKGSGRRVHALPTQTCAMILDRPGFKGEFQFDDPERLLSGPGEQTRPSPQLMQEGFGSPQRSAGGLLRHFKSHASDLKSQTSGFFKK